MARIATTIEESRKLLGLGINPNTADMKKIKVRAYTLKEAEEIMRFCLRQGYEGVQNDSYRYCKQSASWALRRGVCFICVNNGGFGNIIVCDTHWREHRLFKELSKSKFKEVLIPYKHNI